MKRAPMRTPPPDDEATATRAARRCLVARLALGAQKLLSSAVCFYFWARFMLASTSAFVFPGPRRLRRRRRPERAPSFALWRFRLAGAECSTRALAL